MKLAEISKKVDAYYTAREARLAADKEAAKLKVTEEQLKGELISICLEGETDRLGGKLAAIHMHTKNKPVAKEWPQVYKFIQDNDAFDILHKRLTEAAIESRREDGIIIPGIDWFPVYSLTITNP